MNFDIFFFFGGGGQKNEYFMEYKDFWGHHLTNLF